MWKGFQQSEKYGIKLQWVGIIWFLLECKVCYWLTLISGRKGVLRHRILKDSEIIMKEGCNAQTKGMGNNCLSTPKLNPLSREEETAALAAHTQLQLGTQVRCTDKRYGEQLSVHLTNHCQERTPVSTVASYSVILLGNGDAPNSITESQALTPWS